ncbi:DUF294 nucleotidyltransferase-like domain-containing protein [Bacillota bacterium Lsc_1132]
MEVSTYNDVRTIRELRINDIRHDHFKLNLFHDELMTEVIHIAIRQTAGKFGPSPSPFTFFVMGSAGRFEQSVWSDQDHGIIFTESGSHVQDYFLRLGEEITKGLFLAGYPYCDGGVMAQNPLWCKSLVNWQEQLISWINESTWESIRHLLIFIDARPLFGEKHYVKNLKQVVYEKINLQHNLQRIWENTIHVKKGINALSQFLVEEYGSYTGMLNFKERVLLPYINAARILAFKDLLDDSSTLSRLKLLKDDHFAQDFSKLLEIRLLYGDHSTYDSGHFLAVNSIPKKEQKHLKEMIKRISVLQKQVLYRVEKGDFHGEE